MELTHRWAKKVKQFLETQALYGHQQFQFGLCKWNLQRS